MARVELRGVSKTFGDDVRAVRDLSLDVADGELLVVVGPSGCGKSTVLRLIAGLDWPTAGEILFDGESIDGLPPQERNVALVFQNYALYPHMTVRQNLEFPLRMQKTTRSRIDERVTHVAGLLELESMLERRPRELSGGQRQRVAMGRAIVRNPRVFLMDEPLSNLDARLRVEIRAQIAALQRELGVTMIYVTHDQVEAMTLGQRVAVLDDGELQQLGPAQEIYDRPANVSVARFIGSPRMNLVRGILHRDEDRFLVAGEGCRLPVGADRFVTAGPDRWLGRDVLLGLRPETITVVGESPTSERLQCRVRHAEALGHERIVHLDPGWPLADATGNPVRTPLIARLPAGPLPVPGGSLTVSVDLSRCHVFDVATGRLI